MRIIKWIFFLFVILFVFGMFHYTLPQRDVVRITDQEILRGDFSGWNRVFYGAPDSGNVDGATRDVRLIQTSYPNDGGVMVFRNEDTGFRWPFYFKFDSSNVHAEVSDLVSTRESPKWVSIKHYGWRSELLSIYPNAISIRPVSGPDVTFFPWFNVVFFVILALILLGIFRLWQRFKRRRIDPMVENVEDAWDDMGEATSGIGGRIKGLFGKKTGS